MIMGKGIVVHVFNLNKNSGEKYNLRDYRLLYNEFYEGHLLH